MGGTAACVFCNGGRGAELRWARSRERSAAHGMLEEACLRPRRACGDDAPYLTHRAAGPLPAHAVRHTRPDHGARLLQPEPAGGGAGDGRAFDLPERADDLRPVLRRLRAQACTPRPGAARPARAARPGNRCRNRRRPCLRELLGLGERRGTASRAGL